MDDDVWAVSSTGIEALRIIVEHVLSPRIAAATVVAVSLFAAGCSNSGADAGPADQVDPMTSGRDMSISPGAPQGTAEFAGIELQPCSTIQLEAYPTGIARASGDYYEGPWCGRQGDERLYVWFHAREVSGDGGDQQIRRDIVTDAEVLSLDLAAQGYQRVCGDVVVGQSADVGYERPGEPELIRLTADVPRVGDPDASDDRPLALVVSVGPASFNAPVVAGGLAPACPPR